MVKFLVDTNVISDTARLAAEHPVNRWFHKHRDETAISSITIAEIVRGIALKPASRRRSQLELFLEGMLKDYRDAILPFDTAAAECWGHMVAQAERRGQTLGRHDSQIGATAKARSLVVVTRNVSDFPFVEVLNPWESH